MFDYYYEKTNYCIIFYYFLILNTALTIQFVVKKNLRYPKIIFNMNSGIEITRAKFNNNVENGVNRNLQAFLVKHISCGIDNERHKKYFAGYEANYVAELITQQVILTAINFNTADSKIINKIIQQKGDAVSKSLIADPSLIAR